MTKFNLLLSSQFVRYGFVGVIGTAVHTGTLWLLTELVGFNPLMSSTIGFLFSLIISYYLNSILTFKKGFNLGVFLKYFVVSSFGLLVNLSILFTFDHILLMNYMVGQVVSIFVVPVLNFALNKYWAFNSRVTKQDTGGIL
ncbi:MAG: GtrA family protein [Paenibacillus sp.]|nr:GtrA family protein [Paenibacillus sp.]